jgi:YVTN family beta-propeller protein
MRCRPLLAICLLAAVGAGAAELVYVGAEVCGGCHGGPKRDQLDRWYLSPHARAYAALALPEAAEIARISGIDEDPFSSPICLGCHATASDVEAWELDPTFHISDGVQCERCHGPGSEYMAAEVMADLEAAMAAGLQKPDSRTCMVCHKEKGSHTAVLEVWPFDSEEALARIAHPGRGGELPEAAAPVEPADGGPHLVGAMVCASCHRGEAMGYTASKWRLTAHAEAFAVLGTEAALKIAAAAGVAGDPRQADACLRCHATGVDAGEGSFASTRGVQCESCHGPGSRHASQASAAEPVASHSVGLTPPTRATCERCHTPGIHGRNFDFDAFLALVDHSRADLVAARTAVVEYKTPFNLAVSPDGRRLYVACEASDSLVVVDTETRVVVGEIGVGNLPHGVCLSPDGATAYVSNRGADTVSVVDLRASAEVETIVVGDEPHGVVTDVSGRTLYVANAGSSDVSVVDLESRREVKRLSAGRGTWGVSRSPDGGEIYVTNNLPHFVPFRVPSRSEVTVIGTGRAMVDNRIMIAEANLVQGVDVAPGGEFALVTLIRTKNLVPMTRVLQGWVMTNGIGVLWRDGRVDQLLLDEPDNYFADPTDVVITPDGRLAFVTGGGIDAVAVVDLERMRAVLEAASEEDRRELLPNHLGVTTEFVERRIPVGRNPRGLAVSPDGRFVFVAEALDDAVAVIDVARRERVATIDLGGPEEITLTREGERVFHSAEVTYGRQFSCHSCHPDGGIDAITYDIEPDGIGFNPVDNRTLRGILDTAPFKWTGKNPTISRQCGPRLAVFFTRIDPFTPDQVVALERYIRTIPRNPNRYRVGEELSPAQRRGKALFERALANSGAEIPVEDRCSSCHPAPYFTNREQVSVGTASELDTHDVFDIPHLNNIYESAPYLHDGRADTLEEIWTRFNPNDEHGVTNDMTKDQLNDLIEYLKTL